jgi:hypothetical protein
MPKERALELTSGERENKAGDRPARPRKGLCVGVHIHSPVAREHRGPSGASAAHGERSGAGQCVGYKLWLDRVQAAYCEELETDGVLVDK